MKRIAAAILSVIMLLTCVSALGDEGYQKFNYYFFGTFDTIITLTAYTKTREEFDTFAQLAESEMRRYHQIYDQYNPYNGVQNLYTINQQAGKGPVAAEPELIDLLLLVKQWHEQYSTVANPAMGTVLGLWHDAREDGTYVPDQEALQAASEHVDFANVAIDAEKGTIAYLDPELKMDLGAVAKGYAAQCVADSLRAAGLTSFILNAGGNVICGDAPADGRPHWTVAIEEIDGKNTKVLIGSVNQCIVTSGDYQRYYEVNGKRYHHIIDSETLQPSSHMHAVTVIHPDSGLADFLSTTAFLLPYEESRALIESIPEAEGLWTLYDGSEHWTEGFQTLMDKVGN